MPVPRERTVDSLARWYLRTPRRERQRQAPGPRFWPRRSRYVSMRERGRIRVDVAPLGWIDQQTGATSTALLGVFRFVPAIA